MITKKVTDNLIPRLTVASLQKTCGGCLPEKPVNTVKKN